MDEATAYIPSRSFVLTVEDILQHKRKWSATQEKVECCFCFWTAFAHGINFSFFNWDSLYARLNKHYETWSYKKNKHKKIKAYRESV